MENLDNAKLTLGDGAHITYTLPSTPLYTNDEVEFWYVTDTERVLICKDSYTEIVLRGDYVINKSILSLEKSCELDNIAKLYSKTFLTKKNPNVDFDRYMFFDGIGYTTWISFIERTMTYYLRIDHIVTFKKCTNIFSGFVDKTEFLSWWNRVKLELRHLL